MASFRKNNSGRWEVRYRSPDGRQRTKGGFPTKSDAKAWANSNEHSIATGKWVAPELSKLTVAEWVDTYLAGAHHLRDTTRERNAEWYQRHVLPSIGTTPIGSVTPYDIKRVFDPLSERLAPRSVHMIWGITHALFKAAVELDMIPMSPMKGVKLPQIQPTDKRFLSVAEIHRLADTIDHRYRATVYIGCVLGLRYGEIAGLRVRNIDFLRKKLTVEETLIEYKGRLYVNPPKSKASRRTLTLSRTVVDAVARHLEDRAPTDPDERVFKSKRGALLRYANFHQHIWTPAVNEAGLEGFTPHGMRHTAAGLMIEAGTHPRVMQQRLGHASIITTLNVYGAVLPSVEEGVADALDELLDAPDEDDGGEVIAL